MNEQNMYKNCQMRLVKSKHLDKKYIKIHKRNEDFSQYFLYMYYLLFRKVELEFTDKFDEKTVSLQFDSGLYKIDRRDLFRYMSDDFVDDYLSTFMQEMIKLKGFIYWFRKEKRDEKI